MLQREGCRAPTNGAHPIEPDLAIRLAHSPKDRVDEATRPLRHDGSRQADGLVKGGVVGHPHAEQLVHPQPEDVQRTVIDRGHRTIGSTGDDRVIEGPVAQRAERQLRREGGIPALQV